MKNFAFPYFGEFDLNNLEKYYELDIDFDETKVQVDIHFREKNIDIDKATTIKNFLLNIANYAIQNKSFIEQQYHSKGKSKVKRYIKYHLTDLNEEYFLKLSKIVDLDDNSIIPEIQLLKKMKLTRVGLFPRGKFEEKYFAEFDYIIDRDFMYIPFVLQTDDNNNLENIVWES